MSSLVRRSQCFHRSRLRGPRGRFWFQRGLAGPFQVSCGFSVKCRLLSFCLKMLSSCCICGRLHAVVFFWKLLRCIVYFCIGADVVVSLPLCRWVKQDLEFSKSAQLGDSGPKLDLGFKEGQTITLNIGVRSSLSNINTSSYYYIFKTF